MNYMTYCTEQALANYDNQPRERLLMYGSSHLSDLDLITILLGSGSRQDPVFRIAGKILALVDEKGSSLAMDQLRSVSGIGTAKAAIIMAALELGRRRAFTANKVITVPGDIFPLVRHYADRLQEHFICVAMNGAHEVISCEVVSIGLVNRTIVHPRDVFCQSHIQFNGN